MTTTLLLCVLQASLLSAVGLVLFACCHSRWPIAGKSIVGSCLIVVLFTSLAAPVPLPVPDMSLVWQSPKTNTVSSPELPEVRPRITSSEHNDRVAAVSLPEIFRRLAAAARNARSDVRQQPWANYAVGLLMLGTSVGLLRLSISMLMYRRVGRNARQITCCRCIDIFRKVSKRLELKDEIFLAECAGISSAAAVGLRQPKIWLPAEWRTWSDKELQTVLAHELAHIAGRDTRWRLLACLVGAIHFLNPLVYLLSRCMALHQELWADHLAARVIGKRDYLLALSSLALKQNDHVSHFQRTGWNPVFSGFLIRRINMLRTDSGWKQRTEHRSVAPLFVVGIMLLGSSVFAVRGIGQEGDEIGRVASLPKGKSKTSVPVLFERGQTSPNLIPANQRGMFKLRSGDLFQQPTLRAAVPALNLAASNALAKLLHSDEAPILDVANLEELYGPAVIQSHTNPEAEEGHKNVITIGTGGIQARFRNGFNLSSWMEQFAPKLRQIGGSSVQIFELPPIPTFGPHEIIIAARDNHTLCMNNALASAIRDDDDAAAVSELKNMLSHETLANDSSWVGTFQRLDGGLLTLVSTNAEIKSSTEFQWDGKEGWEREASQTLHSMLHAFEVVGIGLDLHEATGTVGLRCRVLFNDHAQAQQYAQKLTELQGQQIRLAADHSPEGETDADHDMEMVQRIIAATKISVETFEDQSGEIVLQAEFQQPDMLRYLASDLLADISTASRSAPSESKVR